MIPLDAAAATVLAGMIYVLVPGPATLAALSLSASKGRVACAAFLGAHLLGDVVWSMLAILALAGVTRLGPELFDALGVVCGLYLIWLGARALGRRDAEAAATIVSPLRAGLAFGLTNPKAYPFAIAMFTAVLSRFEGAVAFETAPALIGCALVGFVLADILVIVWTGLPPIQRVFGRHRTAIARATGAVFILFGLKTLHDAVSDIRARA